MSQGTDFHAAVPAAIPMAKIAEILRRARLHPEPVERGWTKYVATCPVCATRSLEAQEDEDGTGLDCEECRARDNDHRDDGYTAWRIWTALGVIGSSAWPEVVPLTPEPLSPMPLDGVPGVVREHVEAVADALQVPTDMMLLLDLAALGVAAQGLAQVRLGPDWSEELSVFTMTVLPSGERKSAAAAEATGPIEGYEAGWVKRTREGVMLDDAKRRALEKRQKAAETRVAKASDPDALAEAHQALEEVTAELAEFRPAPSPRLMVDDTTPEALAGLLAVHGRLGAIGAEGGLLDTLAGRYADGVANLDVVLKAYGGETVRVDRRGRPAEIVVRPLLTLGLAVQHDVIDKARRNPAMMGRGLVPRFLMSAPQSLLGTRDVLPGAVPASVRRRWTDCLHDLLAHGEAGAFVPFAPCAPNDEITLEDMAAAEVIRFAQIIETGLHPDDGEFAGISAVAGKAVGLAGRIAALLHLAEHGPPGIRRRITEETMCASTAIVETHLRHAIRLLHGGVDSGVISDARTIARWMIDEGRQSYSERDILTGARKRSRGPDRMDRISPALRVLDERGWIRREGMVPGPTGGKPASPIWEVNPAVKP